MLMHRPDSPLDVSTELDVVVYFDPDTNTPAGRVLGTKKCVVMVKSGKIPFYGHERILSDGEVKITEYAPTFDEFSTTVLEDNKSGLARELEATSAQSRIIVNSRLYGSLDSIVPTHVSEGVLRTIYTLFTSGSNKGRDANLIEELVAQQQLIDLSKLHFAKSFIFRALSTLPFLRNIFRGRNYLEQVNLTRAFQLIGESIDARGMLNRIQRSNIVLRNLEYLKNHILTSLAKNRTKSELMQDLTIEVSRAMSGEGYNVYDINGRTVQSVCSGCRFNCPKSDALISPEIIASGLARLIELPGPNELK
jgi:hypothetical protein